MEQRHHLENFEENVGSQEGHFKAIDGSVDFCALRKMATQVTYIIRRGPLGVHGVTASCDAASGSFPSEFIRLGQWSVEASAILKLMIMT